MLKSGVKVWVKRSVLILLGISGLLYFTPLPDPLFGDPYATTLRSKDGRLLSAAIAEDEQWRFAASDSVPYKLATAFLLFEDEYFAYHPGVNPVAISKALYANLSAGKVVRGASTISMQVVRMAMGNQPRTYTQKLLEIAGAFKLEVLYSKDEILRTYVDHAPFGGNIVGVGAAAWRYFGRPSHALSWAEAAMLAVLPNDPSGVFPGRKQQELIDKRDALLDKMHAKGYLDKDEVFLAKQEGVPSGVRTLPNQAYHLLRRSMIEGHTGQNVVTTIDAGLQARVEHKVNQYSRNMSYNEIHNAAAVVIDIEKGHARAYVGNSLNPGEHGQHVDVVTARRSPGSLLKPFLYAAALDDGLILPQQLLPDVPVFYKGFAPKNFDKQYRGAVPADQALISSLNVPFVHLLIQYGYEKFHQKLQQIGFHSLDRPASHYGLSLILGGGETSLWELTAAYAAMARAYINYPERPYRSGYDASDYRENQYIQQDITHNEENDGYLKVPSIGAVITAMRQVERPDSEAGWQNFESSGNIAWKTGTSYGFRDAWAIGFNHQFVVGVWLGNGDGEGRPGLTGVRVAAPLMFDLFDLLDGNGIGELAHGKEVNVCAHSGMIANAHCTQVKKMRLPDYLHSVKACTYHKVVFLNKERTHRVNNSCYQVSEIQQTPWFILPANQAYYYKNNNFRKLPPFLKGCLQSELELFDLIYPNQYSKVRIPVEQDGQMGKTVFEATHEDDKTRIFWHIDNEYVGTTRKVHQMSIYAIPGPHVLTLVDEAGNKRERFFEVVE